MQHFDEDQKQMMEEMPNLLDLTTGGKKVESLNRNMHPVEENQANFFAQQEEQKMKAYSALFGTWMPFKLIVERNLLASQKRAPGLESHMVGLNTAMGRTYNIEFEDVLDDFDEDTQKVTFDLTGNFDNKLHF
mmetsp:Transcript_18533/g.21033  ORF Transcript_18533/g.21033 Transcript_18533/m.21033 type:complete len:133 (+) Transcript_18533:200-598(+)|eukprot:CAMPEP_0114996174 /NCGR_PEP_ID=MMETSP0216-20121206/14155_1 /TAXON_ID=223996 /ORGANISM="Protocruzia adherens, Strain Boccale" /LENGTH=132 /DNA_ID=CAMNT_0002360331 /DNA_START=51 /DNA_END=449 /DNA_ORIENTATION=-